MLLLRRLAVSAMLASLVMVASAEMPCCLVLGAGHCQGSSLTGQVSRTRAASDPTGNRCCLRKPEPGLPGQLAKTSPSVRCLCGDLATAFLPPRSPQPVSSLVGHSPALAFLCDEPRGLSSTYAAEPARTFHPSIASTVLRC